MTWELETQTLAHPMFSKANKADEERATGHSKKDKARDFQKENCSIIAIVAKTQQPLGSLKILKLFLNKQLFFSKPQVFFPEL